MSWTKPTHWYSFNILPSIHHLLNQLLESPTLCSQANKEGRLWLLHSVSLPRLKPLSKTNTGISLYIWGFLPLLCHLGKLLRIYSTMSLVQTFFWKSLWNLFQELLNHTQKKVSLFFRILLKKGFLSLIIHFLSQTWTHPRKIKMCGAGLTWVLGGQKCRSRWQYEHFWNVLRDKASKFYMGVKKKSFSVF